MTRRIRIPHLPIILAALFAGAMFATPAPPSGQVIQADGIPVPTASIPARSGASLGASPMPAELRSRARSDGEGAPSRAVRPTAAVTPRPTARATRQQKSFMPAANRSLSGLASWYATGGPGEYGAMHGYVDGTHVSAVVCAFPASRATCVTVPIATQCGACRWRKGATLIDLSDDAFLELGVPLSVGLVAVTVELVG